MNIAKHSPAVASSDDLSAVPTAAPQPAVPVAASQSGGAAGDNGEDGPLEGRLVSKVNPPTRLLAALQQQTSRSHVVFMSSVLVLQVSV